MSLPDAAMVCGKCISMEYPPQSTLLQVRVAQPGGDGDRRIVSLRVRRTSPLQQLPLLCSDPRQRVTELRMAPCRCTSPSFFAQLMQRNFVDAHFIAVEVFFADKGFARADLLAVGKSQAILRMSASSLGNQDF